MTDPTQDDGADAPTHAPGTPMAAAADPEAHEQAVMQTAIEMHTTLGQKIEDVAKWLFTTLPGKFADIEAAIAAIKALI